MTKRPSKIQSVCRAARKTALDPQIQVGLHTNTLLTLSCVLMHMNFKQVPNLEMFCANNQCKITNMKGVNYMS